VTIPDGLQFRSAALNVDAAGDVVLVYMLDDGTFIQTDFAVLKLAGATGAELWGTIVPGSTTPAAGDEATSVVTDGVHVYAAGQVSQVVDGDLRTDMTVVRLSAATGAIVDIYRPGGKTNLAGEGAAVAVRPGGRVAAAGEILVNHRGETRGDFAVLHFAGALVGTGLSIVDTTSSRLVVRTTDRRLLAVAPGSPGDPRSGGAVLTLHNPASNENAQLVLPAAGWQSLPGAAVGQQTYRYRDAALAMGPCKAATIKSGKTLKLSCAGLAGFTLDEPAQGTLDVRLTLGSALPYCFSFAGASADRPGIFKASAAPAPAMCP
jgi:hypothetical protein